jgi:hypothetical protein
MRLRRLIGTSKTDGFHAQSRQSGISVKALVPATTILAIALLSPAALAETTEERQACIGDAFRVCWAAIPNRNDVFLCLLDNRNRLNPACRAVMNQYRHAHRITRSTRATRVE